MPHPTEHARVLRHHREAAVRALLPATTERSWVRSAFVERGDGTAPQLRDVVRVAQFVADTDAGLLLPPELRSEQTKAVPAHASATGLSTGQFMPEKK